MRLNNFFLIVPIFLSQAVFSESIKLTDFSQLHADFFGKKVSCDVVEVHPICEFPSKYIESMKINYETIDVKFVDPVIVIDNSAISNIPSNLGILATESSLVIDRDRIYVTDKVTFKKGDHVFDYRSNKSESVMIKFSGKDIYGNPIFVIHGFNFIDKINLYKTFTIGLSVKEKM